MFFSYEIFFLSIHVRVVFVNVFFFSFFWVQYGHGVYVEFSKTKIKKIKIGCFIHMQYTQTAIHSVTQNDLYGIRTAVQCTLPMQMEEKISTHRTAVCIKEYPFLLFLLPFVSVAYTVQLSACRINCCCKTKWVENYRFALSCSVNVNEFQCVSSVCCGEVWYVCKSHNVSAYVNLF